MRYFLSKADVANNFVNYKCMVHFVSLQFDSNVMVYRYQHEFIVVSYSWIAHMILGVTIIVKDFSN